jgi:hypothetical protein
MLSPLCSRKQLYSLVPYNVCIAENEARSLLNTLGASCSMSRPQAYASSMQICSHDFSVQLPGLHEQVVSIRCDTMSMAPISMTP